MEGLIIGAVFVLMWKVLDHVFHERSLWNLSAAGAALSALGSWVKGSTFKRKTKSAVFYSDAEMWDGIDRTLAELCEKDSDLAEELFGPEIPVALSLPILTKGEIRELILKEV